MAPLLSFWANPFSSPEANNKHQRFGILSDIFYADTSNYLKKKNFFLHKWYQTYTVLQFAFSA